MDSPFDQTNQPSQPVAGFSFPVTSTVDEPDPVVSPAATAATPPPVVNPTMTSETVLPRGDNPLVATPPSTEPLPPSGMKIIGQDPAVLVQPAGGASQGEKKKTKDIILAGLLLVLLAGAVFGFTKVRSLLSSAAEDGCSPINITEQDLTSNSITVRFTTSEACKMQVAYGVDEVLGLQLSEQVAATEHRIKLTPLMPGTPYRYQVRNDENKYEPIRGFLTLPTSASSVPTVVVPTRTVSVSPASSAVVTPASGSAVPTGMVKYTLEDFQLHFGSVDPRFDTDKNGVVNIRDWQLYK